MAAVPLRLLLALVELVERVAPAVMGDIT